MERLSRLVADCLSVVPRHRAYGGIMTTPGRGPAGAARRRLVAELAPESEPLNARILARIRPQITHVGQGEPAAFSHANRSRHLRDTQHSTRGRPLPLN